MSSGGQSIREQAALRAAAMNGQHDNFQQPITPAFQQQQQQFASQGASMYSSSLGPPPTSPAPQFPPHSSSMVYSQPMQQQQQPMYSPHQQQSMYSPQQQQQQYQQQHPQPPLLHQQQQEEQPPQQQPNVKDVRQAWRKFGSRLTQQLEDVRVAPVNGRPNDLAAKVQSAVQKKDPANQTYTTYLVTLWYPHSREPHNVVTVERRYSDFWKFKESTKTVEQLAIPVPFPSKQPWFRGTDERLLHDRVTQLDAWLVYIVRAFNNGQIPDPLGFLAPQPLALPFQQTTVQQHNLHNPFSFSLASALRQASFTITAWANSATASLPPSNVTAVACVTLAKAGCLVTGRVGTGVLFRRLGAGSWSAPVAVHTLGVGWGVGGSVAHCVLVWDTPIAADTTVFCTGRGDVYCLATAGFSVHANTSMEGSILTVRDAVNAKFYGRAVPSRQLLQTEGEAHVPAARPIYQHLRLLLG